MLKKDLQIAVIGATGLVGNKLVQVLNERGFSLDNVLPAASERSVGKHIELEGRRFEVRSIQATLESKPDVALFSAGGDVSKEWAPAFRDAGIFVIDNSSAWRMDPQVPLIIPEVNGKQLIHADKLIANPNCSTIQLALVLSPFQKHFGLQRVIVSTYQSVTGSGQKAVDQLMNERAGKMDTEKKYPHPIDLNCLPHCDDFQENGYTKEEMKVINESRKILGNSELPVTATAVRVPVTGGHSESVNVELQNPASTKAIREALADTPGITVCDNPANLEYPMPLNSYDKDDVFVGRIRKDESRENCWNMWIVADNLRKGAATNAVQILEYLYAEQLIKQGR